MRLLVINNYQNSNEQNSYRLTGITNQNQNSILDQQLCHSTIE